MEDQRLDNTEKPARQGRCMPDQFICPLWDRVAAVNCFRKIRGSGVPACGPETLAVAAWLRQLGRWERKKLMGEEAWRSAFARGGRSRLLFAHVMVYMYRPHQDLSWDGLRHARDSSRHLLLQRFRDPGFHDSGHGGPARFSLQLATVLLKNLFICNRSRVATTALTSDGIPVPYMNEQVSPKRLVNYEAGSRYMAITIHSTTPHMLHLGR